MTPEYQVILEAAETINAGGEVWAVQVFHCETCHTIQYVLPEDHPHSVRPLVMIHNYGLAALLSDGEPFEVPPKT